MDRSFPADGPARDQVNAEMKWAVARLALNLQ